MGVVRVAGGPMSLEVPRISLEFRHGGNYIMGT